MTKRLLILIVILLSLVFYIQNKEYRKVQIENTKLSKDINAVHSVVIELKSLEMIVSDDAPDCVEDSLMVVALPNEVAVVDTEVFKDPYEQTMDSILSVTSKYVTKN